MTRCLLYQIVSAEDRVTALDPCHLPVITCFESDGSEVHLLFPHFISVRRVLRADGWFCRERSDTVHT